MSAPVTMWLEVSAFVKMLLLFHCLVVLFYPVSSDVGRPRGVSISKASFYQPGPDFTCLDGSEVIPFDHINDDFCDCVDGSDEPGTSACPNGSFHCTNAGHSPLNIPSSWVNDGLCDCCDGTDEFESASNCENSCKEMGKQAREEAEKWRQLIIEGNKIYQEYATEGKESQQKQKERLEEIEQELVEAKQLKEEFEMVKLQVEEPEKEAKDKHEKEWEDEKNKKKEAKELVAAQAAFIELDGNVDNVVNTEELMEHQEFDIDSNGEVSLDEAKEYLDDQDQVDFEYFHQKVWANIKDIYKKPSQETEETTQPPVQPEVSEDLGDDDDEADPQENDDDYHDEEEDLTGDQGNLADDQMPEYDDNTKLLIAAADKARADFNEANKKLQAIEAEISDIKKVNEFDFGEHDEFYPLKGQCFEYTDREYTYKLCPYDKASQRNKNGGSETSLGRYNKWSGPEDNKFSVMRYDKGQGCWNGPDRSANVIMSCGTSNELNGASEPNRCEYQFKFSTPAACSKVPSENKDTLKDEL